MVRCVPRLPHEPFEQVAAQFPQLRFAWLDVEDQAAWWATWTSKLSRPCWWQGHAALDFLG
jgi:phosphopantetheinyl transferase